MSAWIWTSGSGAEVGAVASLSYWRIYGGSLPQPYRHAFRGELPVLRTGGAGRAVRVPKIATVIGRLERATLADGRELVAGAWLIDLGDRSAALAFDAPAEYALAVPIDGDRWIVDL